MNIASLTKKEGGYEAFYTLKMFIPVKYNKDTLRGISFFSLWVDLPFAKEWYLQSQCKEIIHVEFSVKHNIQYLLDNLSVHYAWTYWSLSLSEAFFLALQEGIFTYHK